MGHMTMHFHKCNGSDVDLLARHLRMIARGMDVIFHGTRYARKILTDDALFCSRSGYRAVSFTRNPSVAAYWALLERDDDEQDGAVFVFDRQRLRARYRLESFHDPIWDTCYGMNDEAEECVWGRNIACVHAYLVAAVWSRQCSSSNHRNCAKTVTTTVPQTYVSGSCFSAVRSIG